MSIFKEPKSFNVLSNNILISSNYMNGYKFNRRKILQPILHRPQTNSHNFFITAKSLWINMLS